MEHPIATDLTDAATQGTPAIPIACDLSAITTEPLDAHVERSKYLLLQATQERQELPDGYALRFGADELLTVAAFIENERQCCPFFTFTVEVTPGHGPLWLRLTGPEGAKEAFEQGLIQLREVAQSGS